MDASAGFGAGSGSMGEPMSRTLIYVAGPYSAPKNPKHESIEDNLRDLSVYSVIFQLLRRGQWGK